MSKSNIAGPTVKTTDCRRWRPILSTVKFTVIATPGGAAAALAAKAATTTIPIVFETGVDPVTAGLVKTLNRPEGNVTGITSLNVHVAPKRVELMHELLPKAKSFAVLVNPANPINAEMAVRGSEGPARALGLQLHFMNASTEHEIESAFAEAGPAGRWRAHCRGRHFFQ